MFLQTTVMNYVLSIVYINIRHEWERAHHLEDKTEVDNEWEHFPYITNINEDPQLSGVIKHTLSKGDNIIINIIQVDCLKDFRILTSFWTNPLARLCMV